MKTYYRLYHFYFRKTRDHFNFKKIGIYDSIEKADAAKQMLQQQEGFEEYPDGFHIIQVLRFSPPKLLNKTFWETGFFTYTC